MNKFLQFMGIVLFISALGIAAIIASPVIAYLFLGSQQGPRQ